MGDKLLELLNLGKREMVCFVGAGGKSTLMLKLAREIADQGNRVLVTTSTKMYRWQLENCAPLLIEQDEDKLLEKMKYTLSGHNIITAAAGLDSNDKVYGLAAKNLDQIFRENLFSYVLVESDGAKGKYLKAPGEHEPVIPSLCTTVVPVVALNVIGCPLTEEYVHRASLVAKITGKSIGSIVDEKMVFKVVEYYKSIVSKRLPHVRVVPFFNRI